MLAFVRRIATASPRYFGSPLAFPIALGLASLWLVSGPLFHWSSNWILVPATALETVRALPGDRMPDAVLDALIGAGLRQTQIDLGDPGVIHDRDVARAALPPYIGPVGPPAGHVHEWGAQLADVPDDAPLEGPSLAPYEPAGASEAG